MRWERSVLVSSVVSFKGARVVTAVLAISWFAAVFAPIALSSTLVCDSRSLTEAVARAAPGSEIVLCDGQWNDAVLDISGHGQASKPIRITAQTPGSVEFTGESAILLSGSFIEVDGVVFSGRMRGNRGAVEFRNEARSRVCNDCRLTNSAIVGFNPSNASDYKAWVQLYGQRNTVDRNFFDGKRNRGPIVTVYRREGDPPDHSRIEYNYFSRPPLGQNNGESVQIGQRSEFAAANSNATVARNYFFQADGEVEAISVKASRVSVVGNTIESSRGTITLRHGRRNRVEGNFILGNNRSETGGIRVVGRGHTIINNYIAGINPENRVGRGGIVLISGDGVSDTSHYTAVTDVLLVNNTFVDVGSPIVVGGGANRPLEPSNVTIGNNIIVNERGAFIVDADKLADSKVVDNILFGSDNLDLGSPGQLLLDPKLVKSSSGGVWVPSLDSPARGAGSTYSTVTLDILRRGRPVPYDIGAFNVSDAPGPIRGPSGRCDVGPATFAPDGASCGGMARPEAPGHLTIVAH